MSEVIKMHLQDGVNVGGGGGGSDAIWLPNVSEQGVISWTKSTSTTAPTERNIKGADGQNGQDGADGLGIKSVAVNGSNHLIVTFDDDTTDDAGEINVTVPIDDSTAASNKVYSSAKVEALIDPIDDCFEQATRHVHSVFANQSGTLNGITYDITDDAYQFNGTASSSFYIWSELIPAGTYTFSTDQSSGTGLIVVSTATSKGGTATFWKNIGASPAQYNVTFAEDTYLRFTVYSGNAVNLKFRFWYNEGSDPLPYEGIDEIRLTENALPDSVKKLLLSHDVLSGKKWAVAGDSFTAGDFTGTTTPTIPSGKYAGQNAVYPYLIGHNCNMEIQDLFRGGRTLAYPADGTFDNSFSLLYQTVAADADYLTIYFGINDSVKSYAETGNIPLGTISDDTVNTFYGAWNVILSWLITNRPNLKIGIIVSNGCDSDDYRTATIAIAEKYGIPYIDMNGDKQTPCMIRSTNASIASAVRTQRTLNWRISAENQHPNAACHAFEATFIEDFLRSL